VQWGVDTETFRPDCDDSSVRTRLGLDGASGQPPLILCTRSLSAVYNQDVIVEAMAVVHDQVPEAHLVLKYGLADGPYHEKLLGLVRESGLTSFVHFVGPTPYNELPGYYAAAAIFVSVASSDSTPVSLLEAMACGAVPIVSDLPALREWVTDGVNGFVVDGHNSGALAHAVARLLQDCDLRSRFSRLNREIILSRADHRSQMDEMEGQYLRLAHPVKTLTP
jgi:L-malate glycosyltransferase